MPDPDVFVQHLHDRCEAVRGAGRRCNEAVLIRFIEVMVHAVDKVQRAIILDRGRDDYLFHTGRKVGRKFVVCFEYAGAVDNDINPKFCQGKVFDLRVTGQFRG